MKFANRVNQLIWRVTLFVSLSISMLNVLVFEHIKYDILTYNAYVRLTEFLAGLSSIFLPMLFLAVLSTLTKKTLTKIFKSRKLWGILRYFQLTTRR